MVRNSLDIVIKQYQSNNEIVAGGELPPTIDVAQAADYLDISRYTVINRIKQGEIDAYKEGGRWKITKTSVEKYQARKAIGLVTNQGKEQ